MVDITFDIGHIIALPEMLLVEIYSSLDYFNKFSNIFKVKHDAIRISQKIYNFNGVIGPVIETIDSDGVYGGSTEQSVTRAYRADLLIGVYLSENAPEYMIRSDNYMHYAREIIKKTYGTRL